MFFLYSMEHIFNFFFLFNTKPTIEENTKNVMELFLRLKFEQAHLTFEMHILCEQMLKRQKKNLTVKKRKNEGREREREKIISQIDSATLILKCFFFCCFCRFLVCLLLP